MGFVGMRGTYLYRRAEEGTLAGVGLEGVYRSTHTFCFPFSSASLAV